MKLEKNGFFFFSCKTNREISAFVNDLTVIKTARNGSSINRSCESCEHKRFGWCGCGEYWLW